MIGGRLPAGGAAKWPQLQEITVPEQQAEGTNMTDATILAEDIVSREQRVFEAKDKANAADLIAHAARKSGRHPLAIGRDMLRYVLGKSRLSAAEYVQYGFYDPDRYTQAQRDEFIAAAMHGRIVSGCLDMGWWEVAGDKWLNSVFLAGDDTPQPETLAVIDRSPRAYQGARKIDSPDGLRDFLTGAGEFPLFCKFNNGRWSLGANVITGAEAGHVHLKGQAPMSYDAFFEEIVGGHIFLIQRFVENHSFLKQYTSNTATVRMVNMWRDDGLWTPHAILKLPSAQNVADNFWRAGNLLCDLDVETGEVLTVVGRDGPDLVRHFVHPETGRPILGERLPHWEAVRALNERVAALHHPVRYSTQDIAITEDGPVEIEFNFGGAFELPQIASGRGFLTPGVRAFFRSQGSKRV